MVEKLIAMLLASIQQPTSATYHATLLVGRSATALWLPARRAAGTDAAAVFRSD